VTRHNEASLVARAAQLAMANSGSYGRRLIALNQKSLAEIRES
jgi:hypothetical protein